MVQKLRILTALTEGSSPIPAPTWLLRRPVAPVSGVPMPCAYERRTCSLYLISSITLLF